MLKKYKIWGIGRKRVDGCKERISRRRTPRKKISSRCQEGAVSPACDSAEKGEKTIL